ncbi:alpha/beta fold hydrolase [Lyngbya confervoides]|uniref:Alpha/beta fold hydrolase n=1 Tax=Lyngbya confervoides BDU141951 TaxID=1574623 RepID=A0ABD4T073_9CYAN|nr:alpha/beta fold hydrolase [Lyngbya confervoides]MCM1982066.1 alpha/beta fold hydrolase [Lyngbya confervoides BDU141951]
MLLPHGFEQKTLSTRLGAMVYATARGPLWQSADLSPAWPTLVFLHGFGGGSSNYEWSKVYPAFAHSHRVFAPDLIGWGRSERSPRAYRIEDYLSSITDFLAQTCPGPATVVASSLTAALTLRLAVERPELFRSLILISPAGLADFGEDRTANFFAQLASLPILDRVIYFAGIANEAAIRQFLEQRQFAQANRVCPEMVQAYAASAQQPYAEYSALSFVRGHLSFDLAPWIRDLHTPTAMIWGQQCSFTPVSLGRRLAALNPRAIQFFQELDHVGLTPQLEVPATTIGLIAQLLQQLQVAPPSTSSHH